MATGIELIAAERKRQVRSEGYTANHDADHVRGELAMAAVCYAAPECLYQRVWTRRGFLFVDPWPFNDDEDKRQLRGDDHFDNSELPDADRIRLLVKAGALIVAEIDRLQRAQKGR